MKRDQFICRIVRYLVERFSLPVIVPLTLLHLAFLVQWVSDRGGVVTTERWVTGYLTMLGVLICLRFLDEDKDAAHDRAHYPTRPVQRGLVSLAELRGLTIATFLFLAVINLALAPSVAFGWLALLAIYVFLMRFEFGIGRWLRSRLLIYLVLHQLFVPLLFAYLVFLFEPTDLTQFGLFLTFNTLVYVAIELARKIRASGDEVAAVDTYSNYVGRMGAVLLLLIVLSIFLWLGRQLVDLPEAIWFFTSLPILASLDYLIRDTRATSQLVLGTTVLLIVITLAWVL